MTREEVIEHLRDIKKYAIFGNPQNKALDMAIKALEAIEKIKTEIKNYLEDEKYSEDGISDVGIGLELALNIIDRVVKEYTE